MIKATFNKVTAVLGLLILTACSDALEVDQSTPTFDLGNFSLGHVVPITDGMVKAPISRTIEAEAIQQELTSAIEARLGRYEGNKTYHLGVKVDAYGLGPRGFPVLVAPKSVLVLSVTVWNDSPTTKVNDEPELVVAFESFAGAAILGTGWTRTKEEQLEVLARNAAAKIEELLTENAQWFGGKPSAEKMDGQSEITQAMEVLSPK